MLGNKGFAVALAAGSVFSLASLDAAAQTVCNRQVGPDVIVGALHRGSNNTLPGAASTNWSATVSGVPMCAFSVGTTSCNVGNFNLSWQQNNNLHPVIGQNLYRLKTVTAGAASYQTFEQLGQSWLKHGFCALTQFECCASCPAPGGCNQFLVPACSDPYTASRNSQQSSLGPKWQVNANTGVFTYPPANPPGSTATSVSRRMAVRAADLSPSSDTSAQFFVEGQYVSQDDAAAGNQDNNASYRHIHFTGGPTNYTMWLDGATIRERSGIQAWKVADPTVTESTFKVPDEGKLIVSSKATDLGNGMWHYEFAVYNMNSDLGIGGFSVPLPDGATVENIGFHDVEYRDGDGIANQNISTADWTQTRTNGTISWATLAHASNPNGNGIRWGTTFNFRFDTDVAPAAEGNATLGMWKNPALSYDVLAQVPGAATPPTCYPNCDNSTVDPVLNVSDFSCFLQSFAAGASYANCDNSTVEPVLNVSDFSCFLQSFAAGCR